MNYTDKFTELNPADVPMVETDYYKHMLNGGYLDNIIDCKVSYLETLGFVKGTDKVSAECLRTMGYIHSQYFRDHIRPNYKPIHPPIPAFTVTCNKCGKNVKSKDALANLNGEPFKDYRCKTCT